MADTLEREIDSNFDAFIRQLRDILTEHAGKFALMRNRSIDGFFHSPADAEREGYWKYPDGIFSVQEVTDEPVDLGFFNYAIDQGADR